MKTCTKCKQTKQLDLFATKTKSKDGKTSWCKACYAEHARIKYHNGDRERKELNRKRFNESNKNALWLYLQSHPCIDCGETDPEVLEFDHRDETDKSHNVCEMLWNFSWQNIEAEIAKCDVKCANCHRRRTNQQFGLWRALRVRGRK